MNFREMLPFLTEGVQGTYAAVTFDPLTLRDLVILQDMLGIPNKLDPEKFHSTLLYSRVPLPRYVPFGTFEISPTSDTNVFDLKVFKTAGGKSALVLAYTSEFLENRHKELMELHGATWDHPSFIPHITLSYDIGDMDIKLGPISFLSERRIVMGSEYSEPLNLEWSKQ